MLFHRLAASLVGASMALSATPALALSVNLGTSADAQASVYSSRSTEAKSAFWLRSGVEKNKIDADTNVAVRTSAMQEMRARCEADADSDDCTLRLNKAGHFNAGVAADASITAQHHENKQARVMNIAERFINHMAKWTKRMCGAESSDATVVATCMNAAKVDIKAKFNAMIDASFSM